MKATAAIYARTSKEYKNVERISIDQQLEDATALAAAKNLGDVTTFIDADRSGSLWPTKWLDGRRQRKSREGMDALVAAIEAGHITTVIIRKIDRMARGTEMSLRMYRLFQTHRVRLVATHENLPGADDASGMFTLTVLAAAAELELAKIKSTTKAGKAYCRRHDLKMGGIIPTGYAHGPDKTVVVDDANAKLVNEIFQRFIAGESLRSIGKILTDKYPSPKRQNGFFANQVSRVIRNVNYIGMREGVREVMQERDGKLEPTGKFERSGKLEPSKIFPAIVDPSIFSRANEILKNRTGVRYGKYEARQPHLLSGLLKCGYCGRTIQWGRERCGNIAQRCIWRHGVDFKQFRMTEQAWIQWIESFFAPGFLAAAEPVKNVERAMLLTKLERINSNITALQRKIANGDEAIDLLSGALEMAATERDRVQRQLAALPPDATPSLKAWADMKFDEQRAAVLYIIDHVTVYSDRVVVRRSKCGGGRPNVTFPLMKRLPSGYRGIGQNCLTPRKLTASEAAEVFSDNGLTVDWSAYIDDRFWHAKTVRPDRSVKATTGDAALEAG